MSTPPSLDLSVPRETAETYQGSKPMGHQVWQWMEIGYLLSLAPNFGPRLTVSDWRGASVLCSSMFLGTLHSQHLHHEYTSLPPSDLSLSGTIALTVLALSDRVPSSLIHLRYQHHSHRHRRHPLQPQRLYSGEYLCPLALELSIAVGSSSPQGIPRPRQ